MDPDEAALFLEAQDPVMANVHAELTAGRKVTHWVWFIFPQLAVLGRSPTSQLFGLHDLNEATDYLAHPQLGARLVEVARLMLIHSGKDPAAILGPVDAAKLQSSMTLFAKVPNAQPEFQQVLDVFFDGNQCQATLDHIATING